MFVHAFPLSVSKTSLKVPADTKGRAIKVLHCEIPPRREMSLIELVWEIAGEEGQGGWSEAEGRSCSRRLKSDAGRSAGFPALHVELDNFQSRTARAASMLWKTRPNDSPTGRPETG